ncbi:PD-(D/E)XK nuclease-like domain-containing protein [Pectobacterium aroidearum]|uniref:RecE family exodeoxyribonuclease n=1 Tax=Pectobacterium aroidearum TaxID=1201031 RepID=UPI00211487B4|nr:RecE family exodeoxyribonuclease [Pectobacterium aroidearum]UUE38272.1 PD-(D/E)XK nuclease-like domain-containing protein [Pectobacterium aroidearum]UUE42647.1 PD-(D/E)XK nuclease-like domain-containing protein [Pectobacterium aroidearum]
MNTYAFLIKAKAKSDKKSLFCWLSAKSDSRAEREIMNILEDDEIPTGRGGDYNLPLRTDWFVVDDLPEEGVLDDKWCDRYELNDDGKSWRQIPKSEPVSTNIQDEHAAITGQTTSTQLADAPATDGTITIEQASFAQRIGGGWLYTSFVELSVIQQREISALQHDMEATYFQNLLLALNNAKELLQAQHCFPETLFSLIDSIKSVWPQDSKAPSVGDIVSFAKEWLNARNEDSTLERSGPYRHEVTAKWAKKSGVQRTESGAIAGDGGNTDRGYTHTLDTLDIEIALFTTPFDFDIYNIPGPVYRRAKEIVANKEQPFKTWSLALRSMSGVLGVFKAGIGALIRKANQDVTHFPDSLQRYINSTLTAEYYTTPTPELLALARHTPTDPATPENVEKVWAGAEEALSEPINTDSQPEIKNVGKGMFSVDGLVNESQPLKQTQPLSIVDMARQQSATKTMNEVNRPSSETPSNEGEKPENDGVDNVQMETAGNQSIEAGAEVSASANDDGSIEEARAALESAVNKWVGEGGQPEEPAEPKITDEPPYFEPGRYEGVSNNDYHAANGVSSTQVKDARVSLMYFNARHVAKTIARENSKVLDMGNLVHALALQPENLLAEFSVEPVIPEGAFTTTATIRAFIDEHNASLPALLSADDIKALLEEYNATLPAQIPMGSSADETGQSYMSLPPEYQRIEEGQKQTVAAMKACIKEYNATLPAQMKTSGSRDTLIEQLTLINPDLVAQEAQKPAQLKVSGTKSDLIQSVKSVNPDAVFADELLDAWRENPEDKILVTRAQLETAQAIQKALLSHPTAGKLLTHPSRAVEVSYFGFDDETGLEVRVRPDLEIDLDGVRIGCDLKTISMWNVKQDGLRAKLHREIIDRDYHLSAAMYCETAVLDQFFWIFVNKDEGYHWIAIVEASAELLELGMLEYRKSMRAIAAGFDTGEWPAPIVADYADELNDFDQRRLEALRMA